MGLVEGLAGDIGETGESGEIGEMVDIAKSSYLAKHGMHVELSYHLKWKGEAQLWESTSLVVKNKENISTKKFQGENSQVLINSDCIGRIYHRKLGRTKSTQRFV